MPSTSLTAPFVARDADRGPQPDPFDSIVGRSARFRHAVQMARLLTRVNASVLLQGETGVGKELFARALHQAGPGREEPFVALNCGGLPRELLASELFGYVDGAFTGARRGGMIGKLEAAHGGTLFLDEIAEMPLDLQPYLLRVLEAGEVCPLGSNQPRPVRFRLVAACNRELRAEVQHGRFRGDLFYRVSVTSLRIPPLRERPEDLPLLVEHFSREVAVRHQLPLRPFHAEVMAAFQRHPWPGNARELRNVVESMLLLSDGLVVGVDALPPELAGSPPCTESTTPEASLAGVQREAIASAIRLQRGNLARAAKDLRISRSTLYLKIQKYKLEPVLAIVRDEPTVFPQPESMAGAGLWESR
jgi:transcriptional regulator with PAS, ATPase and Fis domain